MSDARTGKRFALQLPIRIGDGKSRKHKGTTFNMSAAGIFMRSDANFQVGSKVVFDITLPADLVGGQKDVEIRCHGRVVRSDPNDAQTKKFPRNPGVACVIDSYKFVRRS